MNQDNAGHHEGTVGQIKRRMPVRDLFHEPHHVVAEKTDSAAVEPGQAGALLTENEASSFLQFSQRIDAGRSVGAAGLAGIFNAHQVAKTGEGQQGIKTDKGITPPFLAALHGFEEKGVGIIAGNLGKDGQRGVEIGDDGSMNRDKIGGTDHFCKGMRLGKIHGRDLWGFNGKGIDLLWSKHAATLAKKDGRHACFSSIPRSRSQDAPEQQQ